MWHVWHNLAEAVKSLVSKHSSCLREPAPAPESPPELPHPPLSHAGRLTERVQQHHTAVHDLIGPQGLNIRAVARRLELSRNTVRRYARAVTWEEPATGRWQNLPSTLDPYKPYPYQRWHEGHTNGAKLHAELRERPASPAPTPSSATTSGASAVCPPTPRPHTGHPASARSPAGSPETPTA